MIVRKCMAQLVEFVKTHCPPSLVAKKKYEGYGYYMQLRLPKAEWWHRATVIADVYSNSIHLYHPQYLSDMEDLARTYESLGGQSVTISYSEDSQ